MVRRKYKDWPREIAKGKANQFYKSADWLDVRKYVLQRDKYICQYYAGKFEQYGHKTNQIKLVRANTVHHIRPLKEYPDLCLDPNNLVSLSHEAHEIIEGRVDILKQWTKNNSKKPLTKERW